MRGFELKRGAGVIAVVAALLLMVVSPLLACPAPPTTAAERACCRSMQSTCMRPASRPDSSCCQHQVSPPPPVAVQIASPTGAGVTPLGWINPVVTRPAAALRLKAAGADASPPPLSPLALQSLLRV